jgi:hypothetical protein
MKFKLFFFEILKLIFFSNLIILKFYEIFEIVQYTFIIYLVVSTVVLNI